MAFEELPTPPGYAPIPGVAASDDTSEDTPPASQARYNVHTIEFITLCFATNVVQNSSLMLICLAEVQSLSSSLHNWHFFTKTKEIIAWLRHSFFVTYVTYRNKS